MQFFDTGVYLQKQTNRVTLRIFSSQDTSHICSILLMIKLNRILSRNIDKSFLTLVLGKGLEMVY